MTDTCGELKNNRSAVSMLLPRNKNISLDALIVCIVLSSLLEKAFTFLESVAYHSKCDDDFFKIRLNLATVWACSGEYSKSSFTRSRLRIKGRRASQSGAMVHANISAPASQVSSMVRFLRPKSREATSFFSPHITHLRFAFAFKKVHPVHTHSFGPA